MSRAKKITIVCWLISALAIIGLAAWFLLGMVGFFPFNNTNISIGGLSIESLSGPFELQGSHSIDSQGIDALHVDWTAGGVTVTPHSGNQIEIREFSQRSLRDGEQFNVWSDGSTVQVAFRTSNSLRNMPAKNLEILVPYALLEQLPDIEISTVSARVELQGVDTSFLRVNTTSGAVTLEEAQGETIEVRTISGRIELSDIHAQTLQLRSTSGRIELDGVEAERTEANSVSGRMVFDGAFATVNARSTSGVVEIRSTILPDSVSVNTVSGAVRLTVPDEGSVSVSHSSVSGRFESEIPVLMHGADPQFSISTTSGRVSIYSLR